MKTSTLVIGGVVLLVIVGGIFYTSQYMSPSTNATSTASTVSDVSQVQQNNAVTQVPGVPIVTTNSLVAPTDTTAVVTGTVIPMGANTTYWYEYGTIPSFGKKTSNQIVGSGYISIPTPGYITGLTKNTTYYFRLVAENTYGRVFGAQNTVQTTEGNPPPVGTVPTAKTLAGSGISRTSANLTGTVTPNKAATQYWFEYGKNGTFGNTTALVSVGDGSVTVPASVAVTNLDPSTTYYYRINAQNQFGTVNGAILTFKTSGPPSATTPSVTTRSAINVGTSTATVRGSVDANGTETKYWFEYSIDPLLSSALLHSTPRQSAGTGTSATSVVTSILALDSKTTYYFRVVAENSQGTVRGDIDTLKTK